MRGSFSSVTVDSRANPAATASRSAPRIFGWAPANSAQSFFSGFRRSSPIAASVISSDRSSRSERLTTSVIPLNITGRWHSKIISESLEYNSRVAKPPPVDRRHTASLNHDRMLDRLSKPIIHEFDAEITRSRGSRGSDRNGAEFGSISALRSFCVVLLADPCSPLTLSTG